MALVWVKVKRVSDAQGCWCVECDQLIADETQTVWHWTKSKALHEKGTGHKVINVALSAEDDGAEV